MVESVALLVLLRSAKEAQRLSLRSAFLSSLLQWSSMVFSMVFRDVGDVIATEMVFLGGLHAAEYNREDDRGDEEQ
jgi:hypothetical protein